MEMQELNLCDDVLKDAVQGAASLAKDKQVDIRLDLDRSLFTYTGDYGRLRQMFLTILDNAVKFSPEKGVVNVSLQDRTVTVSDQGPGIARRTCLICSTGFIKSAQRTIKAAQASASPSPNRLPTGTGSPSR
jgi:signal transduction histidine kinase